MPQNTKHDKTIALTHVALPEDLDAGVLELLGDGVADDGVEVPQGLLAADDEGDLGAEGLQDARHLHRDVPGSNHHGLPEK